MKNIDSEVILDEIEKELKAKLNNKFDAINQEKDDGITLDHVDPEAYVFQSLDDFPVNHDPFIYYGIESSEPITQVAAVAETLSIEVDIILQGSDDTTIQRKLLRYQRALRELFVENYYHPGSIIAKMRIRSLAPISLKLKNSSYPFKIIGIILETDISY